MCPQGCLEEVSKYDLWFSVGSCCFLQFSVKICGFYENPHFPNVFQGLRNPRKLQGFIICPLQNHPPIPPPKTPADLLTVLITPLHSHTGLGGGEAGVAINENAGFPLQSWGFTISELCCVGKLKRGNRQKSGKIRKELGRSPKEVGPLVVPPPPPQRTLIPI